MVTAKVITVKVKTETTVPTESCDVSKVKVGSQFSRQSFGEVLSIENKYLQGRLIKVYRLRNTEGLEWTIDDVILSREFAFADQCDNEAKPQKITRTKLIEIVKERPRTAMTVCWNKKVDPKAVAKTLAEGQGKLSARAWNKTVAEVVAGEQSVIIGYHTLSFDEHERLRFIKVGGKGGFRLVDTRTLQWVIVNRTKYVVK